MKCPCLQELSHIESPLPIISDRLWPSSDGWTLGTDPPNPDGRIQVAQKPCSQHTMALSVQLGRILFPPQMHQDFRTNEIVSVARKEIGDGRIA